MQTLEYLSSEVVKLGSEIKILFDPENDIQQQLEQLEDVDVRLNDIQAEVKPLYEVLQKKINELDMMQIAKAGVGLALMFIGDGGGSEDWFSGFINSLISELGENLLHGAIDGWIRDSIKDESGLREFCNSCRLLVQKIDAKLIEIQTLQKVAHLCIKDSIWQKQLPECSDGITIEYVSNKFNTINGDISFVFKFGDMPAMVEEVLKIKQATKQAILINNRIEKLELLLEKNELNSLLLVELFVFFGSEFEGVTCQNSTLILVISSHTYSISSLYEIFSDLKQSYSIQIHNATFLYQLAKACFQYPITKQLLQSVQSTENILDKELLILEKKYLPQYSFLNFEDLNLLKKQLINIQKYCKRLKSINQYLAVATQTSSSKQTNVPLTPKLVAAFFYLLGNSFQSISLDKTGVFVINYHDSSITVENFLGFLQKKKKNLDRIIVQCVFLGSIGTQCLKSDDFKGLIESAKSPVDIQFFKNDLKSIQHLLKPSLDFANVKNLTRQSKEINEKIIKLQDWRKKLDKIITSDSRFSFGFHSLLAYISLFGAVRTIAFNEEGDLIISDVYNSHLFVDIQSRCKDLHSKLAKDIQRYTEKLELAEQCLADSSIRINFSNKQKRRKLQVKALVLASTLSVLIPSGWIGWNFAYSEYVLLASQRFDSINIDEGEDLAQLKQSQKQIEEAVIRLSSVGNFPGVSYSKTQSKLNEIKSRKDALDARILTEEQALRNLETSQKLAQEANDIVKGEVIDISAWKTSHEKWQEAITLLETIPSTSFVSAQAQDLLNNYLDIYNDVDQEAKAISNLEAAKILATQASYLVQNPPHPVDIWQNAEAKWQQAIDLLESISLNAVVAEEAQEKLANYKTNYQAVVQRKNREETAANKYEQANRFALNSVESIQSYSTASNLENVLIQLNEANNLLNTIPSDTAISNQAQSLTVTINHDYKEIQTRIKELESCRTGYCFGQTLSLKLKEVE